MILHDRYELKTLLGQKAGRRTWLATDLQTERSVVVKLLLLGIDFEWDSLKLFEREAKTLQDLDHPAIPKYLDWFEAEFQGVKGFALVQTYIPAQSLEAIVQSGRTFSTAELKDIAIQILEILDYLHSRNPFVIHRDLKPSNILLGDRSGNSVGQVSLVDFGSVQNLAAAKGGTITIVGTYGYMPMEQFGDRAVPASDLYSLGATMLYLATGKEPADLLGDDGKIQTEQLVGVESDFKVWIQKLMQVRVSDRPASAQEAKRLLEEEKLMTSSSSPEALIATSNSVAVDRISNPKLNRFKIREQSSEKLVIEIPKQFIRIKNLNEQSFLYYSIGCMFIIPFILFTLGLLIYMQSLLSPFGVLTPLYYYLAVMIPAFYIYHRASRKHLLMITANHLQLSQPFKKHIDLNSSSHRVLPHYQISPVIPHYQIWEILHVNDQISRSRHLSIKLKNQIWRFQGTPEELTWLSGELSHFTKFPITQSFYSDPRQ